MDDMLAWSWEGSPINLGLRRLGAGPTLLLLPALSSISTRSEMYSLQERLAPSFATVAVDWPGFGTRPRPRCSWRPETYAAFLAHLLAEIVPRPHATVAAGHAGGYLLAAAAAQPGVAGRLCLLAPTWRGPLPTMMGERRGLFSALVQAGDLPLLGPLLYRANVNRFMLRMMARGHVYADPEWLKGALLGEKLAVINSPGARHAAIRFVTGALDPMRSRAEFLAAAAKFTDPVLLLYGAATPPRSRAEMEALAAQPLVRTHQLSAGKLALHEEYPEMVAEALRDFLQPVAL
ncbi:MAG TPA: alpha/beta hydrolase [Acetobacteraceae bacterium]|nr:alpha/beta hydrolase [Acetobacteraceae bacterium]